MTDRLQRLNLVVIAVVILYAMAVIRIVTKAPVLNPLADAILVFLTSIGFYRLLVLLALALIEKTRLLLRVYWGRLFVDGLWSYTYTIDGKDDSPVYFGVWRFEQTLFTTRVVGFGLNDKFAPRSRVWSVTDMICEGGLCEVVNKRNDSVDPAGAYFSRTTMYFELNRGKFLRYPTRMRGQTIVYGGPLSGKVCSNYFVRHEDALTEEDVIGELRANFVKSGAVHPPGA